MQKIMRYASACKKAMPKIWTQAMLQTHATRKCMQKAMPEIWTQPGFQLIKSSEPNMLKIWACNSNHMQTHAAERTCEKTIAARKDMQKTVPEIKTTSTPKHEEKTICIIWKGEVHFVRACSNAEPWTMLQWINFGIVVVTWPWVVRSAPCIDGAICLVKATIYTNKK